MTDLRTFVPAPNASPDDFFDDGTAFLEEGTSILKSFLNRNQGAEFIELHGAFHLLKLADAAFVASCETGARA